MKAQDRYPITQQVINLLITHFGFWCNDNPVVELRREGFQSLGDLVTLHGVFGCQVVEGHKFIRR